MRPYGSPKQLEKRRRRAIQLLKEGKNLSEAAKKVGSSISSVMRWQEAYQQEGDKGLSPLPVPGRPCKLTGQQKKRLTGLLLKGAQATGYGTDIWTTRRVRKIIKQEFGVTYHVNHLWRFLTGLGWSWQKPECRAKERDEKAIAHWKRYRWPHIKKVQNARSAYSLC